MPGSKATPARPAPTPEGLRALGLAPRFDDLDGLLEAGRIRVAVAYSKTHYFIDRGRPYGLSYEALAEFERFVRQRHGKKHPGRAISIVYLVVPHDQLLARLQDGRADLAVANLTVTPERQALVDFTEPAGRGVRELLVTRAGEAALASVEELSGREVVVRASSSFREHLDALNVRLVAAGKAPVRVVAADELLATEDLIEMVNAGLVDATVADEHVATLWKDVFTGIQLHTAAPLADDGRIGWAVRRGAPRLLAEANAFLAKHRIGTEFGNVLMKRYLKVNTWARRALDERELRKFEGMIDLFRRYGDRYGFDHLLLLAQGYQESGLDQSQKSHAGAIGVMQLLPSTGAEMGVGDIRKVEPNVHAGAKYLKWIIDHYLSDPAIGAPDRMFLAFAAYNAGPNRVRSLRRQAAAAGLDPNVWFGNVEVVAAEVVGLEPVHYVSNISKYYVAYRMVEARRRERR